MVLKKKLKVHLLQMAAAALAFCCLVGIPSVRAQDHMLEILAVNYPPYEIENPENGLSGFDLEVVEEVFRRMGRPAKVRFRPWARAKKMVFEGRGFALLSCGRRKDRDAYLHYSDPLSQLTWGYFYHHEFSGKLPETVENLRGHSISVVRGYNQHHELDDLGIPNHPVNSDAIAVTMVAKQRVEFGYIPREAAAYQAAQMGFAPDLRYKVFRFKPLHLCISRKWPEAEIILKQFNHGLEELKQDGTFIAIHSKYSLNPPGS